MSVIKHFAIKNKLNPCFHCVHDSLSPSNHLYIPYNILSFTCLKKQLVHLYILVYIIFKHYCIQHRWQVQSDTKSKMIWPILWKCNYRRKSIITKWLSRDDKKKGIKNMLSVIPRMNKSEGGNNQICFVRKCECALSWAS